MAWLPGFGEKFAITLAQELVKASAGVVRRKLARSEEAKALQRAVAAALAEALAAVEVPDTLRGHYEHLLELFLARETVVAELAQLLDPRPGVEIDFAALSQEFAREHDLATLQHLDLDSFLRQLASGFYAAAAGEPALRDSIQMKLLGEMIARMGGVRQAAERTAAATEQMSALLARYLQDQGVVRRWAHAYERWAASGMESSRGLSEGSEAATLRTRLHAWLSVDIDPYGAPGLDLRVRARIVAQVSRLLGPRLPHDPILRESLVAQLRAPRWSARCGAAAALLAWPGGPPDQILEHIAAALDDRRGLEAYPAQLAAAATLINRDGYAAPSIGAQQQIVAGA